jgi:hypothetical protein
VALLLLVASDLEDDFMASIDIEVTHADPSGDYRDSDRSNAAMPESLNHESECAGLNYGMERLKELVQRYRANQQK